jgi:hypothetical protein
MEKIISDNMKSFTLYESSPADDVLRFKFYAAIELGGFLFSVEKDMGVQNYREIAVRFTPEQFQTFVDSCNDLIAVSKGDFPFKPGWAYSCTHRPTGEEWFILGINKVAGTVCAAGWPPSIAKLDDCTDFRPMRKLKPDEIEYRTKNFGGSWI